MLGRPHIPLLVFAKEPRPGCVKTRLAAEVGAQRAAAFAAAMLADTLELLLRLDAQPVWLYGDRETAWGFGANLTASAVHYAPQGGGHLGARMARAVEERLAAGADGVLLLGADTPHLPADHVRHALAGIAAGSFTLGPAADGGYVSLGIPRVRGELEGLFAAEDWGEPTVLARTRAALQATGRLLELEPFWDIDRLGDLVQWHQRALQAGPRTGPRRTLALLEASLPAASPPGPDA